MAEYLCLMSIFSQPRALSAALKAFSKQVLMYVQGQQGISQSLLSRRVGGDRRLQPL